MPFFETNVSAVSLTSDNSFSVDVVDQTDVKMTFTATKNPTIDSETAVIRPNIMFDAEAHILYHEAIETSRHVVLNTPPHEVFH